MAFKRSAVRSRLSPPRPTVRLVFFLCLRLLRVFQANKQQRFDPAYLHQINLNSKEFRFFLMPESLSGKQTTSVLSRLSLPRPTVRLVTACRKGCYCEEAQPDAPPGGFSCPSGNSPFGNPVTFLPWFRGLLLLSTGFPRSSAHWLGMTCSFSTHSGDFHGSRPT